MRARGKRGAIVVLLAGCILGIYLAKVLHRGFKVPYVQTQLVWSIGIYAGKSPFNLVSPPGVKNPVLTPKDVTDVPASSLADPFMVLENGQWHLFMEVLNRQSKKGEIGLATSKDGKTWRYQQIVLAELFRLAFPYVFKADGGYYMIPDTTQSYAVRLYRAVEFPGKWALAGILLPQALANPCLIQYSGKWWLFGCRMAGQQDIKMGSFLEVFFADNLLGPYVRHPKSPVASGPHFSRPGGRVIDFGGRLVRYAQDTRQLHALEITKLTPEDYEEKEIPLEPPLRDQGRGWNGKGLGTVDPHPLADGTWIACVDGQDRVLEFDWK